MRKSLVTAALAAALVCSPLAFAATPPAAGAKTAQQPAHRGERSASLFDQLGLSDSQRTSIQQMMRQNFEQARPEMEALRQKEMAFNGATPGSTAYQTATNDLAQAESNASRARVMRQADLRTKIYNMLTPEQRTKFASIQAERATKIKQWRESQARGAKAPAASSK